METEHLAFPHFILVRFNVKCVHRFLLTQSRSLALSLFSFAILRHSQWFYFTLGLVFIFVSLCFCEFLTSFGRSAQMLMPSEQRVPFTQLIRSFVYLLLYVRFSFCLCVDFSTFAFAKIIFFSLRNTKDKPKNWQLCSINESVYQIEFVSTLLHLAR